MPIVTGPATAILTGLKSRPAATPLTVGAVTATAQATMAAPALKPASPVPVPVPPTGMLQTQAMMIINSMIYSSFGIVSKIINSTIGKYLADFKNVAQQITQTTKMLHDTLKAKQQEIKDKKEQLENEAIEMQKKADEMKKEADEEQNKIENEEFKLKQEGKDTSELDSWKNQAAQMAVDAANQNVVVQQAKEAAEKAKTLSELTIGRDWESLKELANQFEVPIPPLPPIPALPALPMIPPIPQIPEQVKAIRKALAIWMATPSVPPIGVALAAIKFEIISRIPTYAPYEAAKAEVQEYATTLRSGGAF